MRVCCCLGGGRGRFFAPFMPPPLAFMCMLAIQSSPSKQHENFVKNATALWNIWKNEKPPKSAFYPKTFTLGYALEALWINQLEVEAVNGILGFCTSIKALAFISVHCMMLEDN